MGDLLWQQVNKDYRERAEKALAEYGDHQGAAVVADSHSVWGSPDKVSYTTGVMHCVKPKGPSPNRAYMWQTIESVGFRRLKTGIILPYRSAREAAPTKKVYWRNTVPMRAFAMLLEETEQGEVFQEAMRHHFGVREFADLFPAAPQMGIHKYMGMPWTIRGCYRGADPAEFTARAFGKTRVTKKLVKAVSKANPTCLAMANQVRGLAEPKAIAKWLSLNEDFNDDWLTIPNMRKIFLHINPKSIDAILQKTMDNRDKNALGSYVFREDNIKSRLSTVRSTDVFTSIHSLAYGP